MKKILIIIIILIGCFSYYGVVNDDGEKVANIQEIMYEQEKNKNNEIQNNVSEKNVVDESNSIAMENTLKIETQSSSKDKNLIINSTEVKEKNETKNKITNVESKKETTKKDNSVNEKQSENKKVNENKTGNNETNHIDNCLKGVHGMDVGNSKKWFDTKNEAIAQYEAEIKYWGDKWTNYEISDDEYYKNCPYGYEVWTCMYCNKWTLNYYYDN